MSTIFLGYCEAEHVDDANNRGRYKFPKTKALEKVVHTCIYGGLHGKTNFERFCLYDKIKGAYWSKLDLSNCAALDLNNLEEVGFYFVLLNKHLHIFCRVDSLLTIFVANCPRLHIFRLHIFFLELVFY